ncbi:hypothetical protein BGW36DRAFT_23427 [Talaromyces proteolyticus]|uniref:Uncharacterized protein n=1 Tax=Talaromyces proteolyticus TaxID=1131652 RepID=A0AAD4PUT4_9EURO|nr:uncharacterized protein BGW36DRAFT_23427 [Talaromyces proteolyticus]KAH8692624.1 hypothetical protein BGW36DRAFT_23427 [Talaromyces proteolyticus]
MDPTKSFQESTRDIINLIIASFHSSIESIPSIEQIKTNVTEMDRTQVAIVVAVATILLSQLVFKFRNFKSVRKSRFLDSPGFPLPEAAENFNLATQEPLKFRPFRPKYHLTMGLETLNPSELIPMDMTYKERIRYRRKLLREHHDIVVAIHDESDKRIVGAISELYRYIMSTYLPVRYPTMFRLHETAFESGKAYMLENLVMNELYPSEVTKFTSPLRALEILLKTVDEDFLILLPEDEADEKSKYRLVAYETCYPAGFNPRKKLGNRLAKIHEPVPGYAEKLEKSVDRYFESLEVGKYVRRVNWSISTNTELFAAFGGLHSNAAEKEEKIKEGELDIETTLLRCERQTLHRLPTSKALVFGFHTYTYPLSQIKEEGLGEDLAVAIDGLKEGSSPAIHGYKRGPVWADAVKAYLRSKN